MEQVDWAQQVREAYDEVAVDYAELLRDELAAKPLDRALLTTFAELAQPSEAHPLVDLGCGPGRVSAFLASLVPVFGIDLSSEMISVARTEHPGLRFEVGSMTHLTLDDASVSGALAWYSLIHFPDDILQIALAEIQRILIPGGYLLLASQTNGGRVRLERGYGHEISLDVYRRSPETLSARLADHGLDTLVTTLRQPVETEKTEQLYLIACKPR
jgi:ubiquinone/menaquinone biosynthesis C-methylase UbiE